MALPSVVEPVGRLSQANKLLGGAAYGCAAAGSSEIQQLTGDRACKEKRKKEAVTLLSSLRSSALGRHGIQSADLRLGSNQLARLSPDRSPGSERTAALHRTERLPRWFRSRATAAADSDGGHVRYGARLLDEKQPRATQRSRPTRWVHTDLDASRRVSAQVKCFERLVAD